MSYQNDVQDYTGGAGEEDRLQSEAMRKLFVGGLNRETTQDGFSNYFSGFGNVVDIVIITDPNTQKSRGFGFVTFENSDSVQEVFKSKPHVVDGKTVDVKRAMPREFNTPGAHGKTTRLFIGGFKGLDLEPDELKEYIEGRHPTSFGQILNIDFLKDKETNKNKGFGFLECSDTDFADRLAISESTFSLKGRQMSIKKAEPKDGAGGQGGMGGRGGRGMRGGYRGGRGGRGGNRGGGYNSGGGGGYGNNDSSQGYGGNSGYNSGYGNNQSSGGFNQNSGYNSQGGYNQQQSGYNTQGSYAGYGNQSYGNSGGYQQQQQQQSYGGYNNQDTSYNTGNSGYNQGYSGNNYTQNSGGNMSQRGGKPGGGNNRYQPY